MKKRQRKGLLEGKSIEIGGIIYPVIYRSVVKIGKRLAVRGAIDFDKREIEIQRGMSASEEIEVIMHEILHGVIDTLIPPKLLDSSEGIEEIIVMPFSRVLVSALRSANLLKE